MGISQQDLDDYLLGGTDGTKIGNVGDNLKVSSSKDQESKADFIEIVCLMREMIILLKASNRHLEYLSERNIDVENDTEGDQ